MEEIQAAVDGSVSKEQAVKLRQCFTHIDELAAHKEKIEEEILQIVKPYSCYLDLLRTIPGCSSDPMTAVTILSEIGNDMSVFPSSKHLTSWAGCCPRNDQSAKHVKSTRISRAGAWIKPLLVQISNALIRSKKHPEFSERYRRIKVRRGHRKAIIAICRMFLTAIWNILTKLEPYSSDGFLKERSVDKKKTLSTAEVLKLLKSRGYIIKDSPDDPLTA